MNKNSKYLMLARREIWEHRGLWMIPVVGAGFMLGAALFGTMRFSNGGMDLDFRSQMPAGAAEQIGAVSLLGVSTSIGLFAAIVTGIYLMDCLFAERKDRSILFWKSLPVSDAETVLTKLGVALLAVPTLVLALTLVLQPLLAGVVALRFPDARPFIGELLGGSLAAVPRVLGLWVVAVLWYAPLAAYLMLASVLAKRAPVMYAVVPPLALVIAERVMTDGNRVTFHLLQRLFPWPQDGYVVQAFEANLPALSDQWWRMFGHPALWLGLVAAVAMTWAAIRLRRYRDDT